ncbi:MAG: PAS domain-containing protein [Elusimicrobia bacterium]|nr:PAS domain-containing protein [Elusimicrobiota bacterium]
MRMISLREKILVNNLWLTCVVLVGVTAYTYYSISTVRKDTIGTHLSNHAALIANNISAVIQEEVTNISIFADQLSFKTPLRLANASYGNITARKNYFASMDQQWLAAAPDSALVQKYIHNTSGAQLYKSAQLREKVAEIFITDRFGGLVATSAKTSDFFQADEEWWQKTFQGGAGKVYVGPIEFEASSQAWSIPIGVPIRDLQGKVIGILKEVFDLRNELAARVEIENIPGGMMALLADNKGEIIFSDLRKNISGRGFLKGIRGLIVAGKKSWIIGHDINGRLAIITYAGVENNILLANNIHWGIIMSQETAVAFVPIRNLFTRMFLLALVLLFILVPFNVLFSRRIIDSIAKLHQAMQKVSTGDLNYRPNIKTGDEIEQLAQSFNWMITDLRTAHQDITDRKLFFENIINSMSDSLVVLHNDGTIREVNIVTLNLLGYTREELTNKTVDILFQAGENVEILADLIAKTKRSPPRNVVVRYRTKTLRPIPVSLSCTLVRDKKNEIDGLILVGTDLRENLQLIEELNNSKTALEQYSSTLEEKIRERTRTLEQALQEARETKEVMLSLLEDFDENRKELEQMQGQLPEWNEKISVLIGSLNEGVIMLDRYGDITIFNETARSLLGFKNGEEVDNQQVLEILKGLDLDISFVQSWQENQVVTKDVKTSEPLVKILHFDIAPILSKGGQIIGLAVTIRDITRQKEAERLKTEFISMVSHELRTPITCIRESISQVMEGIKGEINPGQKEFLGIATEEIDRLTRIINDLLDVSKIEAGKITLNKTENDIVPVIRSVTQNLEVRARERQICLDVHLERPALTLFFDIDRIKQVLSNLIDNAIKFSPDHGKVDIFLVDKGQEIEIMVEDHGQGIAGENFHKIFDRFEQINRTTGSGYRGTGLGLPISQSLIEKHGGTIRVQSELEKGSKFIFTLPKLSAAVVFNDILREQLDKARKEYENLALIVLGSKNRQNQGSQNILAVMEAVAAAAKYTVRRAEDLVWRFEEDTLVAVLVRSARLGAVSLQKRIMDKIKEKQLDVDQLSGAVVMYPEDGNDAEELLQLAKSKLG